METAEEVHFDPYDPRVTEDPYPFYALLRAHAPVYRNEERDFWALSRHADVVRAWVDEARYSSANGNSIEPVSWGPNAHKYASLLAMDPPMHTRVRRAVTGFFGSRGIARLQPAVHTLVHSLLQELRGRDSAGSLNSFDFIRDFADRLPMRVLCLLMGVEERDHARLQALADAQVRRDPGAHDAPVRAIEATLELIAYFDELVRRRRHRPCEDLVSHLLAPAPGEQRVTGEEIVAFLNTLAAAGNDTVIQLLGNAWYWASRHPAQRRRALDGDIEGWVEETLRFDPPNRFAARTLVEDTVLHGVAVPAGARILLLPGSANRDPAAFPDPHRYDLSRKSPDKVSFGAGRHRCLGARLARLEARVALGAMAGLVADYEVDESAAERVTAAEARGFLSLPTVVRWR
ncbi:cytochrome P450 [Streptomyces sp. NPDC052396]|uniref:cytochrome P450 n=1 Tax=Streptomyces sp. NPDC052396 TaxID=3365689 RepID=UPI0037D06D5D